MLYDHPYRNTIDVMSIGHFQLVGQTLAEIVFTFQKLRELIIFKKLNEFQY